MHTTTLSTAITGLLVLLGTAAASPEAPATPEAQTRSIVEAAHALAALLDEKERATLFYDFDDNAQRRRWSNLPTSMVPRGGLRWGDLDQPQRDAAMAMLGATLSARGLQQIKDNMAGDEALHKRGSANFGEDEYYISILGEPSATEPWMWQFGGHHLGVNATIVGPSVTLAPSLTGGQPVDFTIGDRDVRQLGLEEDAAYLFVGTLTPEQLTDLVVSERRGDLAFGPDARSIQPRKEGLRADALHARQRLALIEWIEARVGILNEAHAAPWLDEIGDELDETYVAWFGPTAPGRPASYRIHGPSLIMEYAPQRLGGDPTDHTHAILRDPKNDYGAHSLQRDADAPIR